MTTRVLKLNPGSFTSHNQPDCCVKESSMYNYEHGNLSYSLNYTEKIGFDAMTIKALNAMHYRTRITAETG